jgi:hypothetical protein
MESWKDIRDFPRYEVSNIGRIRRLKRNKMYNYLKCHTSKNGYIQVCLRKNNKKTTKNVHRLVLEAFVGPCPEGKQCDHIDRDRGNNNVTNLRWVTPKENTQNRGPGKPYVFTKARQGALIKARKALLLKRLLLKLSHPL